MTDQKPPYEAPAVEELETDGESLATAPGIIATE